MIIEIFSDLICPWCFIGKKRLDVALEAGHGQGVDIVWRAYQLYPGIPEHGMAREEFIQLRYGAAEQRAVRGEIESEAERAGIDLNFQRIERMPNTFKGHRLLHHARSAGVQHDLAEALFSAYFEQGRDVGSLEVLLDAAERCGLERVATADYLAGSKGTDEVSAELERAANIGVSGVPCMILAGAFALPGAQVPEVIGHFIHRAKAKLAEAV